MSAGQDARDPSRGTHEAPPRPLAPRRCGPRFATPAERALAAEWCLREYTKGRRQYDIAAELGVNQSTVSDLIRQALAERKGLAVDELRQVRSDAYRGLVEALAPHIIRHVRSTLTGQLLYDPDTGQPVLMPDLDVIARVESLTDKLAKLEGSVAPTQVTVSRTSVDDSLEQLAATLLARSQGEPVPQEQ